MWTRHELKTKAKAFYSNNVLTAILVSLVLTVVSSGTNELRVRHPIEQFDTTTIREQAVQSPDMMTVLTGVLIFVALRIVIGYLLEVGARYYYLKGTTQAVRMGDLLFGFQQDDKSRLIWTLFLRDVKLFLWSLLLVIPGIVKSYSYALTPYILADYPDLSASEVHSLSADMTNGHKMDMFVLDLSFIGWNILGTLAFGIGIIFVKPYIDATHAQLYQKLKQLRMGGGDPYNLEPIDFYSDF